MIAETFPEGRVNIDRDAVRFGGRVAVVTGAGRGMGREFAILLAARGARVVVNDVLPDDGVDGAAATARTIVDAGWDAVASDANIADPLGAASVVDLAVQRYGRIDIVINNAGNRRFKPFAELTDDDLDALLDVHVRGAFRVTRQAWPHFLRQGYGRVLNVASVDGVVIGVPNHAAYGACKGALAGLTRELAVENGADGIRVNALLPGAATTHGMGAVEGKNYAPPINVTAAVVAPGACWLVHEDCTATGRVFTCSSGRMAEVFTRPGAGWQGHPDDFDLERVRENWAEVESAGTMADVHTVEAWNAFRTALFNQMLVSTGSAPEVGDDPAAAAAAEVEFRRARPPAHYTDAMNAFLRTTKFYDKGRPLHAHQVLSNHPPAGRSLNRFLDWGDEAVLSARERRLLVLRTATLARSEYELGVHRQQGIRAGDLTAGEVASLGQNPVPALPTFTARERALLDIADAVCRTDTLTDDQWADAADALPIPDVIECLIVVGYYRMCSGLMNALAIPGEGQMGDTATAAPPRPVP